VTLLTPSSTPGILKEPIGKTILNTPPEEEDSVSTLLVARLVLIDTRLIVHEIGVNGEAEIDGTVGHQLLLDVIDIVSLSLGVLPTNDGRSILALRWASGNATGSRNIREALISGDTVGGNPCSRGGSRTTVAPSIILVARNEILWGHHSLGATLDGEPAADGFGLSESPT
jgi:hypothetical protein